MSITLMGKSLTSVLAGLALLAVTGCVSENKANEPVVVVDNSTSIGPGGLAPSADVPADGSVGSPDITGSCDASAVQYAIGKALSPELLNEMKSRSRAKSVRTLTDGSAATMDFSADRLTVNLAKNGAILMVGCN